MRTNRISADLWKMLQILCLAAQINCNSSDLGIIEVIEVIEDYR